MKFQNFVIFSFQITRNNYLCDILKYSWKLKRLNLKCFNPLMPGGDKNVTHI